MLMLPPPVSVGRAERRSRERRAAERRAAAETSTAASGPDENRFTVDGPDAASAPAFRSRNGGRGRRKTDRAPAGGDFEAELGLARASKPHAPLVAQLIATELGLEQTRVRRRGSVQAATALYNHKAERSKPSRGEA